MKSNKIKDQALREAGSTLLSLKRGADVKKNYLFNGEDVNELQMIEKTLDIINEALN